MKVKIIYQCIDGAHFFTIDHDDPNSTWANGLCSANTNLKKAHEDVKVQLAWISKFKGNLQQYKPEFCFIEFEKMKTSSDFFWVTSSESK